MDNPNTVGSQFRALNIVHFALCAGVVIVLCILRYLVKQDSASPPQNNMVLSVAGVAIAFICVMVSRFLFFIRTKPAMSVGSLAEKLEIFRAAFIVQMALLEASAMINAVLYFLTRNDLHFFIALGVLLLMVFRRPTRSMAAIVLFNSNEDLQQIYDDKLPLD